MSLYYVLESGGQRGPFSAGELKLRGLGREDLVWAENFADWRSAASVTELSGAMRADVDHPAGRRNTRHRTSTEQAAEFESEQLAPLGKHQGLILLFVIVGYLIGSLLSSVAYEVVGNSGGYDAVIFKVVSTINTLWWLLMAFVPVVLALLIRERNYRTPALVGGGS